MKLFSKVFFALVTATLLTGTAQAFPAQFIGTWRNTNPSANGIIRLVVTPGLNIRAFGRCTPTPCDFGMVPFVTYGSNVSDPNHRAGTAHYHFSFKETMLAAHLINNLQLTLRDYNQFTDGSGRQNYWQQNNFRKLTAAEEAVDFQAIPQEPEE